MMQLNTAIPRFNGYRDAIGRFVSFTLTEEVFARARTLGTRVLLRLELGANNELTGMLYTNAAGLRGAEDPAPATLPPVTPESDRAS